MYVEYKNAAQEREYYDLRKDPYEIDNIAGDLTVAQRDELHRILVGLAGCHNDTTCWNAARPRSDVFS